MGTDGEAGRTVACDAVGYPQAESELGVASVLSRRSGLARARSRTTLGRTKRRFSEAWLRELDEEDVAAFPARSLTRGKSRPIAADSTGLGEHARRERSSFRQGDDPRSTTPPRPRVAAERRGDPCAVVRARARTGSNVAGSPAPPAPLGRVEPPFGVVRGNAGQATRRIVPQAARGGGEPSFPRTGMRPAPSHGRPAWERRVRPCPPHPGPIGIARTPRRSSRRFHPTRGRSFGFGKMRCGVAGPEGGRPRGTSAQARAPAPRRKLGEGGTRLSFVERLYTGKPSAPAVGHE